tara:strand:- start:21836 stop:24109 length:2274 start_codon:yes stop_codon:yes gene_type:complete
MKQSSKILFFIGFLLFKVGCGKQVFAAAAATEPPICEEALPDSKVFSLIPKWRREDVSKASEVTGRARAAVEYLKESDPRGGVALSEVIQICTPEGVLVENWAEMASTLSKGFIYYSNPQNSQQKQLNQAAEVLRQIFFRETDEWYDSTLVELRGLSQESAALGARSMCDESREKQLGLITLNLNNALDCSEKNFLWKLMECSNISRDELLNMLDVFNWYMKSKSTTLKGLLGRLELPENLKERFEGGVAFTLAYLLEPVKSFLTIVEEDIFTCAVYAPDGWRRNSTIAKRNEEIITKLRTYLRPIAVDALEGENPLKVMHRDGIGFDKDTPKTWHRTNEAVLFSMVLEASGSEDIEAYLRTLDEMDKGIPIIRIRKILDDFYKGQHKKTRKSKPGKKRGGKPVKFPILGSAEKAIWDLVANRYRKCLLGDINNLRRLTEASSLSPRGERDETYKRVFKSMFGSTEEEKIYQFLVQEEEECRRSYQEAKAKAEARNVKRLELEEVRLTMEREREIKRKERIEREASEAESEKTGDEGEERRREEERLAEERVHQEAEVMRIIEEERREEEIQKRILEQNRRAWIERKEERLALQAAWKEEHSEKGEEDSDSDSDSEGEYNGKWPLPLPTPSPRVQGIADAFFQRRVSIREIENFIKLHEGVSLQKGKNGVYKVYFISVEDGAARAEGEAVYFDLSAFHLPHDGKKWVAVPSAERLRKKFREIGSTPEYWGVVESSGSEITRSGAGAAAAAAASSADY